MRLVRPCLDDSRARARLIHRHAGPSSRPLRWVACAIAIESGGSVSQPFRLVSFEVHVAAADPDSNGTFE